MFLWYYKFSIIYRCDLDHDVYDINYCFPGRKKATQAENNDSEDELVTSANRKKKKGQLS